MRVSKLASTSIGGSLEESTTKSSGNSSKTVEKDSLSIIESVIQSLFFMVVKVGKTKKNTKAKIR